MTVAVLSQRERNKLEKRERILAVARHIIVHEGIEALTMRHLAEVADLSSRTPYNLFGSKTEILFTLMFESIQLLETLDVRGTEGAVLSVLFDRLGSLLALPEEEESFYRSIHWAIMRSDDLESKRQGRLALDKLIEESLVEAVRRGELAATTDLDLLTRHLSVLLASIVGMWADSQLTLEEAVGHTRIAWLNAIRPVAEGVALDYMREQLDAIAQGSPAHVTV